MIRRKLLQGTLLLPLMLTGSLSSARAAPSTRGRVRPSDLAWPNVAEWNGLRRELAGDLMAPTSLLSTCERALDSAECLAVVSQLQNPYYIGDQPSGTQVSGWLGAWQPAPSAYAIACRNDNDVVAGVNFARKHNLRLVIKGGGHSYQGTSNAADSLLIWTRPMQEVILHDDFVPDGHTKDDAGFPAVTVQAGAMWMDVYDAVTTKAGRYVQGGGCATVGVAGLIQSGGFGSFSKPFGTAAGSLLQARIVTADGKLRTVNPRKDTELFWALKGGGGGSFGAVTSLTLRTHDLPEFFGWAEGTIEARSDEEFRTLVERFVHTYADSLCNAHWGESVSFGKNNTLKISMVCQGLNTNEALEAWAPFFAWVTSNPTAFHVIEELSAGARPARGWWDAQSRKRNGSTSVIFDNRADAAPTHAWWRGDQEQVGMFLYGYDSIWLPKKLLVEAQRERLAEALFNASREFGFEIHFNKGLAGAPADAIERSRDTATNPAVLDAFALAIVATGGPSRYPGQRVTTTDDVSARSDAAAIARAMIPLRDLAPTAGSYVSESNYFNSTWKQAFWGSNAERLTRIKDAYDPNGLFFVHHGIGSEKWSADGFVRAG